MMKIIRKHLQKLQQREERTTGFLGRADGIVHVPGKKHWVYVRLWNGELIEAFNNGHVPTAFGLAVNVVYRGGWYYVTPRDAYDQPVFVGLPDGAEEELQWPGLHTLYVRPEQFLPGLIIPKTGMTVYVYGGRLPLSTGGYITIPAQEIDLTPYKPAANAHWATIGWMNNGMISVVTGGSANSLGELQESGIPSTGGYDLAAIKLFNGQTTISHGKFGSVIVDLRFFKTGGAATATWGSITGTLSNQTDLQNELTAAKRFINILGSHGQGGSVPASSTYYMAPFVNGLTSIQRGTPLPLSGVLKNLYVRLAGSQPSSGSLVIDIYNYTTSSTTGISITIPAGGLAGTYSNTTNTYNYSAGDLIQTRLINNATSSTPAIGGVTFLLESTM